MLRLDTFIVAEFVSMLNFFTKKCREPIGYPNIYYRALFFLFYDSSEFFKYCNVSFATDAAAPIPLPPFSTQTVKA